MSKEGHEQHRHPRQRRNLDQLSAKELEELITRELDELMLGHRSDAVPIKLARRALGRLLVHQVSPTALRRELVGHGTRGRPFIDARDWDKIRPPYMGKVHRFVRQLAQHGRAYREMPVYATLQKRASLGKPVVINSVVLDSEAVIDAYCERYLQLIESIRRSGFLTRDEVARSTIDPLIRRAKTEESERDVQIAIGPNGELFRLGTGRHRTAIAKVLGLERMPVEIRVMHAEWLSKLVERSGKSPLDTLLDWLNAAKQHGLEPHALN